MTVGQLTETVVVTGVTPVVDVQNARQAIDLRGRRPQGAADQPQHQQPARADARHQQQLPADAGVRRSRACASAASASSATPASAASTSATPGRASWSASIDRRHAGQHQHGPGPRDGGRPSGQRCGGAADRRADRRLHRGHRATPRKSTSRCRARWASRRPAAPRSTSCRGPAATGSPATTTRPTPRRDGSTATPVPIPSVPALFQAVKSDHDVSVDFGGPIKRDGCGSSRSAATQGIHKLPVGVDFWPNLNEGKWGFNYQPDRAEAARRVQEHVAQHQRPHHLAGDASATSSTSTGTSRTSARTPATASCRSTRRPSRGRRCRRKPNRLQQVSWTNPLNNKHPARGRPQRRRRSTTTRPSIASTPTRVRFRASSKSATRPAPTPAGAARVNQFAGAGAVLPVCAA